MRSPRLRPVFAKQANCITIAVDQSTVVAITNRSATNIICKNSIPRVQELKPAEPPESQGLVTSYYLTDDEFVERIESVPENINPLVFPAASKITLVLSTKNRHH